MPKCLKSMETIGLEFLLSGIFNLGTNSFLTTVMDQLSNYDLWALKEKWSSFEKKISIECGWSLLY